MIQAGQMPTIDHVLDPARPPGRVLASKQSDEREHPGPTPVLSSGAE